VLRIALLTPAAWPETRDEGGRFAIDLAAGLAGRGHRARLITSHRGPTTRMVEEGVEIVRWRRPPTGPLERRQFESHLARVPLSYVSLTRYQAEIAHALHPADAMAAARWTRRTGRPSLFTAPGIVHRRCLVSARRRLQVMLRATAGVSAVSVWSRLAAEALQHWLGIDARVVYPAIALPAMSPAGARAEAPTIFAPVDAGDSEARLGLLLSGFQRLRRELPDARLLLGRCAATACAQRPALLAPGVAWVQIDSPGGLAGARGAAWVSALASCGGAFPFRLVAALACGTPVAAPSEGAVSEVAGGGGVARLFDPEQEGPEQVARALREALEDSDDAETRAACRGRAERFSLERSVDAHIAVYRELLAR